MNVAVVASVLLGLAFLVAGGSKLAAGRAWPDEARGLGAPATNDNTCLLAGTGFVEGDTRCNIDDRKIIGICFKFE